MHSLEHIYSYFPENFFKKGIKALHHYGPTSMLMDSDFFAEKKIKLSPDMVIIQVNDRLHSNLSKINKLPFDNKKQLIELIDDPYQKWISKPRALLNYIKENYNNLPEYIMYVDSCDVVIIEDILNPKEILEFYNCEVLFNAEPNFASTGFNYPFANFYDTLFGHHLETYKKLNLQKYGIAHERSINAGLFLGKKEFMLIMLEEACAYMSSDPNLGFPYGCMDDQYMFRYLQILFFNKISCDVFNKFFLFAYPKTIESDETDWEHYNYFQKNNIHLYKGNHTSR
jgi:hypothetical protein